MDKNKICIGCEHCRYIKAQDGWGFHGCFCEPYKGKYVTQIENCPKNEKTEKRTGGEK